ncbi:MAG: hypothetical protein L0Z62_45285 [Gemmataceae bacterium]|nr:hypothetical protein [Gemmataceae bacterium]
MSENERTNPNERTAAAGPEWEPRFLDLVTTWKRQRGPHSSSARLAEHPAYQEIIGMGPEVIPLLLREQEREPEHWFRALHALTGANPVPAESRGNVREMAEAWLRWGREQGYHW